MDESKRGLIEIWAEAVMWLQFGYLIRPYGPFEFVSGAIFVFVAA